MPSKIVGIIPARYDSTRFPGKPLALILGTSLIQRTYENAKKAKSLSDIIVATDDKRIFDHVKEFGGNVIMTSPDCRTGSDRIAEVAATIDADFVVNIQGDEPCLDPQDIDKAVQGLLDTPNAVVSTAATLIQDPTDLVSSSIVKCVFDLSGKALYFSRSLIPGNKSGMPLQNMRYYRHLGLYVYRKDFLLLYPTLPETPLMKQEDLEQLKILEHGYNIHIVAVNEISPGVDLPEDIEKVEKYLCR